VTETRHSPGKMFIVAAKYGTRIMTNLSICRTRSSADADRPARRV